LPSRGEETLRDVSDQVEALVEECVKGLPTLGHVIRRWLRSAKASEPDVRLMARLQNEDSQKQYAGYMTRFICYTLRVWESCEAIKNTSSDRADDDDDGIEDDDEEEVDVEPEHHMVNGTGAHTITESTGSTHKVDTMKDA
jgi:hypothetical protein